MRHEDVHFLSNIHSSEIVGTSKHALNCLLVRKLSLVYDYSLYMGGVERNDKMFNLSTATNKSKNSTINSPSNSGKEVILNVYVLFRKFIGQRIRNCDFVTLALCDYFAVRQRVNSR